MGATKIGRDLSWYPLNLHGATALVNGFTDALIDQINESENLDYELLNINWDFLLQGLAEEQYPAALTTLQPNPKTLDLYHFSKPFLLLGPVLITSKNSSIRSLNDLEERIVGISPYDTSIFIAQKIPNVVIRLFDEMPIALEQLSEGNIDGVLLATLPAHKYLESQPFKELQIVTAPLNEQGLRLIVLKGQNSMLVKEFNAGLTHTKSKSFFKTIKKEFSLPL